jgi:hypothetical protein
VSYRDPLLQAKYKDGEESLYEPAAFETFVGYIIDFDTGMGKTVNWEVSYQSSASTQVTYDLNFGGFSEVGTQCAILQNESTYAKFMYEKILVDPVITTDRYDEEWPLLLNVNSVEAVGNVIQYAVDWRSLAAAAGGGTGVILYVDDRIVHTSIPAGKHWHWTYEGENVYIYLYTPIYDDGSSSDYFIGMLNDASLKIYPYRASAEWGSSSSSSYKMDSGEITSSAAIWPNLGSGLGSLLYTVAASVTIDRPSIVVQDPRGNALKYATDLTVKYYPIVIKDEPAPVAYCGEETGCGQVDHTLDLYDNDPSTVEARPDSDPGSMTWLQNQKTGHTVEVSLPFLETGDECESTASFLYQLYKNFDYSGSNSTSYTLVCGPDDEPKLGAKVDGYSEYLRVNEISYSYQDGSSYTINVTLGPVWVGVGSWNTSTWTRKTEDVTREGIVVWSAGDGVTYRVRIRGLGEYYALNTTLSTFFPGEKIQTRIYNNPVEK